MTGLSGRSPTWDIVSRKKLEVGRAASSRPCHKHGLGRELLDRRHVAEVIWVIAEALLCSTLGFPETLVLKSALDLKRLWREASVWHRIQVLRAG